MIAYVFVKYIVFKISVARQTGTRMIKCRRNFRFEAEVDGD